MSEIDQLPADQRAVIQLLLKQGKSYDELAELLAIDSAAVRGRAHAALEALGPESGARLTSERRGEVGDYLLGQQSDAERDSTREYLAGSAGARSWARPLAGTLRPLAGDALPEIPAEGEEAPAEEAQPVEAAPGGEIAPPAAAAAAPAAAAEPAVAPSAPGAPPPGGPRSSRLGGALLLGGGAILVAVVVVLLVTSGGGGKSKKSNTLSSTPGTTTTVPQPIAQVNLTPTQSGSKSVGLAQVFAQGNGRVMIIACQGLSPGAYAIWLYTSSAKARLLGFVPSRVGKDGRFVTRGDLPADAKTYSQLVVTSEQVPKNAKTLPTKPGPIVLRGRLQIS
jgi:hypothetical protein